MNTRVSRLREKMAEAEFDAYFVSTPENRRYLSGFTGSAGYLIITAHDAVLATDFRYVEQGGRQSPDFRVHRISGGPQWLPELMKELGAKRIGFEAGNLTVATYQRITKSFGEAGLDDVAFTATDGLVEPLRVVKDADELALLTKAMECADYAFRTVAPTIEVGETERAVAWRLEMAMREAGADGPSFDTIVAAGPNAALPHHRPSGHPIGAGEPVVMDFGAIYQGYCSDMTRTICLGPADQTFREVYDTVLGAQLTASATVEEGMTSGAADGIARSIIEEAGYGDKFGHSLGHGIGLAVHEDPRVGPNADDLLLDQVVFTIEPGIYIPGWGGVRIEDTVVMDGGRVRSLTTSHKSEDPRHTG